MNAQMDLAQLLKFNLVLYVNQVEDLARTRARRNGAADGTRTHAWTLARSRTTPILRPPKSTKL